MALLRCDQMGDDAFIKCMAKKPLISKLFGITKCHNSSLYMLKDALGSTIALANRGGKNIARIGYDAWGNFRYPDNKHLCRPFNSNCLPGFINRLSHTRGLGKSSHNPWAMGKYFAAHLSPYLYTGRRYNNFTTQYFNRNRYYQPKYARFTSKDPIGFNGGYNMYSYVGNNPVNGVDPMGKFSIMVWDDNYSYMNGMELRISWSLWDVMKIRLSEINSANDLVRELSKVPGRAEKFFWLSHGAPGSVQYSKPFFNVGKSKLDLRTITLLTADCNKLVFGNLAIRDWAYIFTCFGADSAADAIYRTNNIPGVTLPSYGQGSFAGNFHAATGANTVAPVGIVASDGRGHIFEGIRIWENTRYSNWDIANGLYREYRSIYDWHRRAIHKREFKN